MTLCAFHTLLPNSMDMIHLSLNLRYFSKKLYYCASALYCPCTRIGLYSPYIPFNFASTFFLRASLGEVSDVFLNFSGELNFKQHITVIDPLMHLFYTRHCMIFSLHSSLIPTFSLSSLVFSLFLPTQLTSFPLRRSAIPVNTGIGALQELMETSSSAPIPAAVLCSETP